MKQFLKVAVAASLVAGLSTAAQADKLPRGAKPASPQKVASAYAGRTDLWKDNCDGGIYFAPNWQARAWCAESSDNLGAGTWTVENNGDLCQDLTWHWPVDSRSRCRDRRQRALARTNSWRCLMAW